MKWNGYGMKWIDYGMDVEWKWHEMKWNEIEWNEIKACSTSRVDSIQVRGNELSNALNTKWYEYELKLNEYEINYVWNEAAWTWAWARHEMERNGYGIKWIDWGINVTINGNGMKINPVKWH
jgi:hypothetical protein